MSVVKCTSTERESRQKPLCISPRCQKQQDFLPGGYFLLLAIDPFTLWHSLVKPLGALQSSIRSSTGKSPFHSQQLKHSNALQEDSFDCISDFSPRRSSVQFFQSIVWTSLYVQLTLVLFTRYMRGYDAMKQSHFPFYAFISMSISMCLWLLPVWKAKEQRTVHGKRLL